MEINPEHHTTQALRGQWFKVAAILVQKAGGEVEIDEEDISALEGKAIVADDDRGRITLRVVSMEEAERLAENERKGGREKRRGFLQ